MKRRYNEEDGQEEGFFQEDEEEEEELHEVEAIIDVQGSLLGAMELDLHEQGLNQELLSTAIVIAKQDIWWLFRSPAKKVRRIERIYRRLTCLVRETIKEEEKKEG